MRNVPFEGCGCDCGSPLEISGVIRNGRRYDDGNVSVETYNQGMQAMQSRINNVGEVATQANNRAAEAEKSTGKLATLVDAIAEKHSKDIEVLNADVNGLSDGVGKLSKQISDTAADFEDTTNKLSERIAKLEGGQDPLIVINSFTATPKVLELGSTANIIVSWNLSRAAAKTTLNGINVLGQQQYTDPDVSANKEYKLTVTDEKGREVKASTSISFANHVYWGLSAETAISETLVETLNNHVLSDSKARAISVQPYQQYVYYAYPKRLGPARFKQGVFEGGFEEPATIRVTNGSSYAEDYYVYRSTNMLNVPVDIIVS